MRNVSVYFCVIQQFLQCVPRSNSNFLWTFFSIDMDFQVAKSYFKIKFRNSVKKSVKFASASFILKWMHTFHEIIKIHESIWLRIKTKPQFYDYRFWESSTWIWTYKHLFIDTYFSIYEFAILSVDTIQMNLILKTISFAWWILIKSFQRRNWCGISE